MSVFTNPAASSREHGTAYTKAILGLLGDRDPLTVLESTSAALQQAVAGLNDRVIRTPEAPGKWSVVQVLQHLADSEVVWAWRMRLVLAQDRPPITGYDQDAWADRLHYAEASPAEALEEFSILRRGNLRLLRRATPDERERVGVHSERGDESIAHMMKLYAGHDLLHLAQIVRIRAAVGSRP